MRQRHTFVSRHTFDVCAIGEKLIYGPETAKAVETVIASHHEILADRDLALNKLGRIHRRLRKRGYTFVETNIAIAVLYPQLWERAYPWQRLAREGFSTIREAAEHDTHEWAYGPDELSWKPALTPREAFETYRSAA